MKLNMTRPIHIAIIGSGSMGCFMAAKMRNLFPTQCTVGLKTSRPTICDAINSYGIMIRPSFATNHGSPCYASTGGLFASTNLEDFKKKFPVRSTVSEHPRIVDLVLIMTKGMPETSNATKMAIELFGSSESCSPGWILSLQNGIGYYDVIQKEILNHNLKCNVVIGSTSMGIRTLEASNLNEISRLSSINDGNDNINSKMLQLVQSSAKGKTVIVEPDPDLSCMKSVTEVTNNTMNQDEELTMKNVVSLLEACDMDVTVRPASARNSVLWSKLVVSATLLPITAMLDKPNGCLLSLKSNEQYQYLSLFAEAVMEVCSIANALHITLEFVDINSLSSTSPIKSSILNTMQQLQQLAPQIFADITNVPQANGAMIHVLWVAASTATNISSMLSDVRTCRATEIPSILRPLIVHGEQLHIPTPRLKELEQAVMATKQQQP